MGSIAVILPNICLKEQMKPFARQVSVVELRWTRRAVVVRRKALQEISKMSKTKSHDGRNAQQTESEPEAPFDDDLRESTRHIPSEVLSLDFSAQSEEELGDMYESIRSTSSPKDHTLAEMYESAQSTGSVKELD